jgi:hypothetical protein
MQDQNSNTFSLRQLNPFRGVLQVFLSDQARAFSADGRVWEIQVLSESPQGLWANTPLGSRQFYTFGLWSKQTELRQVPINPLFNIGEMIGAAERLLTDLRPALDELPFPLTDRYEAWLLDEEENLPLALLQSSPTDAQRREIIRPKWRAAGEDDSGFVSETLLQRGLACHDNHNPRLHAACLEALVNERGGENRRCQWYCRHADGSASPCDEPARHLAAEHFPPLPLSEHWPDQGERALIADYIQWKAPQLLMLPALSSSTRERLERLAVKQAMEVERLWRLYPQIHSQDLLNRARVEAKIRSANDY